MTSEIDLCRPILLGLQQCPAGVGTTVSSIVFTSLVTLLQAVVTSHGHFPTHLLCQTEQNWGRANQPRHQKHQGLSNRGCGRVLPPAGESEVFPKIFFGKSGPCNLTSLYLRRHRWNYNQMSIGQ